MSCQKSTIIIFCKIIPVRDLNSSLAECLIQMGIINANQKGFGCVFLIILVKRCLILQHYPKYYTLIIICLRN